MNSDRLPLAESQDNWFESGGNGSGVRRRKLEELEASEQKEPYIDDYIRFLLQKEKQYLESPRNFRTNTRARNAIVDWLVEVHHRRRFSQTVLYKTVSLMDYYSSKKHVSRNRLPLIGAACMSLTVKNIGLPIEPNVLVKVCRSHFGIEDILETEIDVLKIAEFDLNRPVCPQFLSTFQECFNLPPEVASLSEYFLDLWLFHQDLVRHRGSIVASVAVLFAIHVSNARSKVAHWRTKLAELLDFSASEMDITLKAMSKTVSLFDYERHSSIMGKYTSADCQLARSISQNLEGFDNFLNIDAIVFE